MNELHVLEQTNVSSLVLQIICNSVISGLHKRIRYGGTCECWLPRFNKSETDDTNDNDKIIVTSDSCTKCKQDRLIHMDEVSFDHDVQSVTNELRFRIEQRTGLTASAGVC